MNASEKLALLSVAFLAINLLGVILTCSFWDHSTIEHKMTVLVIHCVGVVVFAVLSAKFIIGSCRQPR